MVLRYYIAKVENRTTSGTSQMFNRINRQKKARKFKLVHAQTFYYWLVCRSNPTTEDVKKFKVMRAQVIYFLLSMKTRHTVLKIIQRCCCCCCCYLSEKLSKRPSIVYCIGNIALYMCTVSVSSVFL